MLEQPCLFCGTDMTEWARKNQKFCDQSCQMKHWYRLRYKKFYDSRYQRLKREWRRSESGMRAGVPIRVWLRLPKDWR